MRGLSANFFCRVTLCSVIVALSSCHLQNALAAKELLRNPTRQKNSSSAKPAQILNNELQKLHEQVENQAHRLDQQERALEQQSRSIEELKRLVHQQEAEKESLRRILEANNRAAGPSEKVSPALDQTTEKIKATADSKSTIANGVGSAQTDPEQGKKTPEAGWIGEHPTIQSRDGNFQIDLRGYGQLDFRGYQRGNVPANTFIIRRARLGVRGKTYKHYEFELSGDFADTSSMMLRDMYLNINVRPELQFKLGHFKAPFSQEEIRSAAYLDFVERSLVENLVPARSPGIMVWGQLWKGVLEYQAGAFNGKGMLALNNQSNPEGVFRLRLSPWKATDHGWMKDFSFGGAYAKGQTRGGRSFIGRSESRSFRFFPAVPINGTVVRANGEFTYLKGPFALRAEFDQANQERAGLGPNGTNLPGVASKGYMAQATYLLTGETKPDSASAIPRHGLLTAGAQPSGAGAWELKFRYSNFLVSDSLSSKRAETFSTGINWYLSRYVKYVLDLNIERFKDTLSSPRPDKSNFFTTLSRIQFSF